MIQTIQQKRARFALEKVQAHVAGPVNKKEYKARANSFPAMIRTNGLGPAAAFYLSKSSSKNDPHGYHYHLLSEWLTLENDVFQCGDVGLMAAITRSDMHTYRVAQVEALLLLEWVAKFARAFAVTPTQGKTEAGS